MLTLHVDMFAGLPGKLFLGVMGLLFVVAIVSSVVLYAPFMQRLNFGTVRRDRSRSLKWLDMPNPLGAVPRVWALEVRATGRCNTRAAHALGEAPGRKSERADVEARAAALTLKKK